MSDVGGLYNPNLLPQADHRGDLFEHKHAMLVQQDIRDSDTNDNLVVPWQMQDKFRPGTIVVMGLLAYLCEECRRHAMFTKFKLTEFKSSMNLRSQLLKNSKFEIPTLPRKLEQKALSFDMSPRKAPSSAFSAFGSPSKKARHT